MIPSICKKNTSPLHVVHKIIKPLILIWSYYYYVCVHTAVCVKGHLTNHFENYHLYVTGILLNLFSHTTFLILLQKIIIKIIRWKSLYEFIFHIALPHSWLLTHPNMVAVWFSDLISFHLKFNWTSFCSSCLTRA